MCREECIFLRQIVLYGSLLLSPHVKMNFFTSNCSNLQLKLAVNDNNTLTVFILVTTSKVS